MISRILKVGFAVMVLAVHSAASYAESLTQRTLDQYLQSIQQIKQSDNPIVSALKDDFENGNTIDFDVDENGNIAILSQVISQLDDKTLATLKDLIEPTGFSSIENWATIGDKISAAMMALELQKEPVDLSELTPEMMAMVPESMRKQMEGAMRMLKATEQVPAEDIALVKANLSKLKNILD